MITTQWAYDQAVRAIREAKDKLGLEAGMRSAAVDELETLRRRLWVLLDDDQLSDDATVDQLRAALAARTPQPAEPLPWLTGAAPDETARVVADVKAEAVWLVLHMQANGTREDIQSALRTLRLIWGDPPPVEQQAAAAVAPQLADPADTAQVGDRLGKAWLDAQDWVGDGGCRAPAPGGVWMCTRSAHGSRQHVATLGSRVVAVWPAVAPQPVVPDGTRLVGTLRRAGGNVERWDGRRWVPTVIVAGSSRQGPWTEDFAAPQPAVPDGEDQRAAPTLSARSAAERRVIANARMWAREVAPHPFCGPLVDAVEELDALDDPADAPVVALDGEDDDWRRDFPTDVEPALALMRADVAARAPGWRTMRAVLAEVEQLRTRPDGEDVPARLDAAADAIRAAGMSGYWEATTRDLARRLRDFESAETRAAVAAALARTPGRES